MRFSLTSNHEYLYHTHGFVEFEEMIAEEEATRLYTHLKNTLCKRIDCAGDALLKTHPYESFMAGRNMWKDDEAVKQIVFRKRHAEIASLLSRKRPIRLGYDQLLHSPQTPEKHKILATLPHLFHAEVRLSEISSLQGVVCGCVLHISPEQTAVDKSMYSIEENAETLCPLPQKQGNAIFFSPNKPLFLRPLFELPNQAHLLIVYCEEKAIYIRSEKDPHTHRLKKLGYVFGDRVKAETHPILFR